MKKFMLAGGGLGFLVGLVAGFLNQAAWPSILWRSSAAALLAGLLLRWWAGIWVRSCQQIRVAPALAAAAEPAGRPAPALPGAR